MAMSQYLLIPINTIFRGMNIQGYKVLTHCHMVKMVMTWDVLMVKIWWCLVRWWMEPFQPSHVWCLEPQLLLQLPLDISWHRKVVCFGGVFWWWRLVCYPLYLLTTMFLVDLSDIHKAEPRWTMGVGVGVGQVVLTKWLVVGQYRAGADELQKKMCG